MDTKCDIDHHTYKINFKKEPYVLLIDKKEPYILDSVFSLINSLIFIYN